MLRRLILFSLIFSTAAGAATWPPQSRAIVGERNATRRLLRNPYLLTIVDQLQLKAGGWGRLVEGSRLVRLLGESREFVTPAGASHGLDVRLWSAPGRPLVVYLPGIFQGSADEDTGRVVYTMLEAGYQVVVIPNPLSAEYFANFPTAPPHALAREAGVVSAAIAELQNLTGAPRVRLMAASYGAAVGARAWAADQASATPRIEDLTLLFPQADLAQSIQLVDASIATSPLVDPPRASIGAAYQASLKKLVARMRRRYAEDARANFAARVYPASAHVALAGDRAPRGLNLHVVLRDFVAADEVLNLYASCETKLGTWLERAYRVRGNANVRILTAHDDWTNPPRAWADLPAWLDAEHVLILNNAGHAGVVAEEWFRQTILEAMR